MNTIYLDIETIPNQSPDYAAQVLETIEPPARYSKPESIAKWKAEEGPAAAAEKIAKTSFDPALGHIACISWAIGDGRVQAASVPRLEVEEVALAMFFAALPTQGMNQFVGHYITGFDLRFILCRAVVLGVKLPSKVAFPRDTKPWGDETFDTMVAWAGARDRISQDNLCRALGLDCKGDFDGSMVAEAWANGEHQKIAEYCKRDVETVRAIHQRFLAVGY